MRLIAISVTVFSGAIICAGHVLAQGIQGTPGHLSEGNVGQTVVVIGLVAMLLELLGIFEMVRAKIFNSPTNESNQNS